MSFYDDPDGVEQYIRMCDDYDGTQIYEALARHLESGQSLLELGCGPGNDIEFLRRHYDVVGSDTSTTFLEHCRKRFPTIEFLSLDAVAIEIERCFDCVFSNKVLHHLKFHDLIYSFKRQSQVIKRGGLFVHTFWIGRYEEEKDGLYFRYHDRAELLDIVAEYYDIVELLDYAEFEKGDSLLVIAKNGQAMTETAIISY